MTAESTHPELPCRPFAALVIGLLLTAAVASAGQVESELSQELRGAWVVLMVEVQSDCAGFYNNNEVNRSGVAASAGRRFAPGELAKIDKINLKRSRLDLFLTLAEPVLASHTDGPFELFDVRECKVQLMLPVASQLTGSGPVSAILDEVLPLVETWPSLDAAHASTAWNQRQREPYPADYELTLARYQVWQAEQVNVAVSARIADAGDMTRSVVAAIRRDADYLDGFAAGVEHLRGWDERDCADLLATSFGAIADSSPSKDHSSAWKAGYEHGQKLVYAAELGRRLGACYVPVPPLPAGA